MNEVLRIETARAAAALEHRQSRRIVLDLAASERSLQELARATGLSLGLLHYHVGRLRALGLVEIAREERRAGRPVKRYRAAAKRFFVPAGLASDDRALERELRAGLDRDRARRDDSGVAYFVDDKGAHRMRRIQGSAKTRASESWIRLSLTHQEAEDLGADLRALFARYARPAGRAGALPVIAYCAFAERA
jgi:DNA-binding transcriptional ArsR family regulator